MNSAAKDPLLVAAKAITILIRILAVFANVMIGIGIGALATVERGRVMAKIAEAGAPDGTFWLLIGAFALIMVLLSLAYRFFDELAGIIDSVGEGEPFRADNAQRLSRMGWLSVGGQALALVLAGITAWFAPYLDRVGERADLDFGMDLTGVLLTLILFILARVFRRGAEMREELEGTV